MQTRWPPPPPPLTTFYCHSGLRRREEGKRRRARRDFLSCKHFGTHTPPHCSATLGRTKTRKVNWFRWMVKERQSADIALQAEYQRAIPLSNTPWNRLIEHRIRKRIPWFTAAKNKCRKKVTNVCKWRVWSDVPELKVELQQLQVWRWCIRELRASLRTTLIGAVSWGLRVTFVALLGLGKWQD